LIVRTLNDFVDVMMCQVMASDHSQHLRKWNRDRVKISTNQPPHQHRFAIMCPRREKRRNNWSAVSKIKWNSWITKTNTIVSYPQTRRLFQGIGC